MMVMGSSRLAGAALQVALTALLPLVLPAYYVYKVTTYLLGAVFPENVAGKVVLITGASSGIGEHLAYEYAKRGAYLALVARREASLREVGDVALGLGSPGVLVLPADVSKPQDCESFVNDTIRYYGRRLSCFVHGPVTDSRPMVEGSAQARLDSEGKNAYATVRSQPNGDKSKGHKI